MIRVIILVACVAAHHAPAYKPEPQHAPTTMLGVRG